MDCPNCSNNNEDAPLCYREAADKVWEMAKEYEAAGVHELAEVLYEISQQIHDLARSKQLECCSNNLISE